MITINTISPTRFSFNGVPYLKNFMPFVTGNKIAIINVYDGCIILTQEPTIFSDYTVNGVTYTSVNDLQSVLLDVLYTRASLGGGGVTSVDFELGTDGDDLNSEVEDPNTTPLIKLNVPTASSNKRGVLSSDDWDEFNSKEPSIPTGETSQYWRGDKTWQTLDKSVIGLSNVDNTSDTDKPVSGAMQSALNDKADKSLAVNNVTLTAANWTLASGLYEYTYTNDAITATSQVDFTPLNASIDIVKAANVYPLITTTAGAAKCYAKKLPTANIIVNVLIY